MISIHALHEESDRIINTSLEDVLTFQSTLSMRRATGCAEDGQDGHDFNPRSP